MKICSVENCPKPSRRHGMCVMHDSRVSRYGNVDRGRMTKRPAEVRFWEKVDKTDGCWLWTGAINANGYGHFAMETTPVRTTLAHRFAFGPVPDGMDLDHLCRVRHCVNPAHLEAVSRQVNLGRGSHANQFGVLREVSGAGGGSGPALEKVDHGAS